MGDTHLILALGRQWQTEFYEFKGSMVYMASSRPVIQACKRHYLFLFTLGLRFPK